MSSARTIGLTAAAMMACAGAASAGTVTQTLTFGPTATNFSHTFSFAGFNPALGTLVKVTDTITETLSGTVDVTNTGSSTATFTAFLTNTAKKTFPGLVVSSISVSNAATGSLGAGDSSGTLTLTGTSTNSGSTTSGLAAYLVTPLLVVATDKGALSLSSSTGDATAAFTDTGTITDVLVYTFTTKIPEPGALVLLGGGLTFLGFTRWRKRRS